MSDSQHPKVEHIDLESSQVLDVIYDDSSLTLDIEFCVLPGHPRHDGGDAPCKRQGFISFTDVEDLRISSSPSAKAGDGKKFPISSATVDPNYAFIDSNWGEIELTAQSIRVVVD